MGFVRSTVEVSITVCEVISSSVLVFCFGVLQ